MLTRTRKALRALLAAAAIGGAAGASSEAQSPAAPPETQPAPASDQAKYGHVIAEEIRKSLDLPGLGVVVAVDGKMVLEEYLGWTDVEGKVLLSARNVFRVGSLSKLLTVTAMARLRQKGRLDIDAPISRYLAGVPEDKTAITPRQLAGHLGGFAQYGKADYISDAHYGDVTESLPRYLAMALLAPPGTKYAYSSYGYNILGAVLQAASGMEFRKLITEEVTDPLGMSNTTAEDSAHPPPERVRLYYKVGQNPIVDAPFADLTDRWPSGGYLSTAADLARLGAGILQPGYLDPNAREELFTPQHTQVGKETGVGLAWRIGRDDAGRLFVHHGGDTVGGRAYLLVYPVERIAVALTTNLTFAPLGEKEARRLAELYMTR